MTIFRILFIGHYKTQNYSKLNRESSCEEMLKKTNNNVGQNSDQDIFFDVAIKLIPQ